MISKEYSTDASKIYDKIYGHIANSVKYEITNPTKSARIESILSAMDFDEKTALRVCCKYKDIDMAIRVTKLDKKKLKKDYKLAKRHMYAPNNIRLAVPTFYKVNVAHETLLKREDFADQKYIVTALNKSGIDTREKLYKHLSIGWYYLWTIPGCGNNARQYILKAIDNWNEQRIKIPNDLNDTVDLTESIINFMDTNDCKIGTLKSIVDHLYYDKLNMKVNKK